MTMPFSKKALTDIRCLSTSRNPSIRSVDPELVLPVSFYDFRSSGGSQPRESLPGTCPKSTVSLLQPHLKRVPRFGAQTVISVRVQIAAGINSCHEADGGCLRFARHASRTSEPSRLTAPPDRPPPYLSCRIIDSLLVLLCIISIYIYIYIYIYYYCHLLPKYRSAR